MSTGTLRDPRTLVRALPTLAVFILLGLIAYKGHEHHWKWGEAASEEQAEPSPSAAIEEGDAPPAPEAGEFGQSAFDSTLSVTHNPATCPLHGKKIVFKNAASVRKAGIQVGLVRDRDLISELAVTGAIDFDPTRIAHVSPRTAGILWQISKQTGDPVQPGEVLAIVDSADVGRAKANFLQAKVQLDLKQQLRNRLQSGVNPESSILTADAALREAKVQLQTAYQALLNLGLSFPLNDLVNETDADLSRRLQFLGLPKEAADTLPNEATNNLIVIRNPLAQPSVVLQRDAVQGETVSVGQPLFTIGDISRMVLLLNIRQEDARLVHKGMPLRFWPDGEEAAPLESKIDWVAPEVDPKTRTVTARAYVDNPEGRLKARAFGRAAIIRLKTSVPSVPEEAVQWEGCSHVVFVREAPNEFKVRKVKLGVRHDGFVEVLEGLKAGEPIAIVGSHVLKSDLFRDRLGTAEE